MIKEAHVRHRESNAARVHVYKCIRYIHVRYTHIRNRKLDPTAP